jgi:hypothetical protein
MDEVGEEGLYACNLAQIVSIQRIVSFCLARDVNPANIKVLLEVLSEVLLGLSAQ